MASISLRIEHDTYSFHKSTKHRLLKDSLEILIKYITVLSVQYSLQYLYATNLIALDPTSTFDLSSPTEVATIAATDVAPNADGNHSPIQQSNMLAPK